jgi:aminopeptidase N
MFEAYLGPDVFRSGIRSYMKARAFSNATSADLWNALSSASGKDMAQIASGWTEQAGFPLVSVAAQCDAQGARTISLSQKRFLLSGGSDPKGTRWNVPLQIRVGESGTPQSLLLSKDDQSLAAGRCNEPLSVNANAIGYYRTQYDAATLATNTGSFSRLPDADRIAMLDDQWALVRTGVAPLPSYLALASSMGTNLDPRAWIQISGALETIEYDERDTAGHDAYEHYARSILKPALNAIGWDRTSDEAPSVQELRQSLIADLGLWGDPDVIAEARRRFQAFVVDHKAIPPDNQSSILSIVAHSADDATFDQIYALGKAATDQAEMQRYYFALVKVTDPKLAERVAQLALSTDIPPEAETLRLGLVASLAKDHQQLSWQTFTANTDQITKSMTTNAPIIIAQYVPQMFWSGVPLPEVESFVRTHVPSEMSDMVDRGMESAHFKLTEKTLLVHEADSYVQQRGG